MLVYCRMCITVITIYLLVIRAVCFNFSIFLTSKFVKIKVKQEKKLPFLNR